jgi:REP element-mobilizing transposase RayT/DNA-binding response OmpR family regulator
MTAERIILVITTSPGIGELIQQTLDESGLYMVLLTNRPEEALEFAQAMSFPICILDAAISNYSVLDLVSKLRTLLPEMRLILIPANVDPTQSIINRIAPDVCLPRSFSPAELIRIVSQALVKTPKSGVPTEILAADNTILKEESSEKDGSSLPVQPLDWLDDINRAAQHLTRLSLETAAQAALIIRDGQLWAYAGQLPQPAAQELATLLAGFLESDLPSSREPELCEKYLFSGDMVRFIHLESTQAMYLFYATSLSKDKVLALAFDSEMPFSKIRREAWHLARALSSPPGDAIPDYTALQIKETDIPISQPAELSESLLTIKPLLDDVPPPNPRLIPTTTIAQSSLDRSSDRFVQSHPLDHGPVSQTNTTTHKPRSEIIHEPGSPYENTTADKNGILEFDIPSELKEGRLEPEPLEHIAMPQATNTEAEGNSNMQPFVIQSTQFLTYTCLLVPRMPQHQLTRDLANHLSEWMGQLCLAFGWRLEQLSIHLDHIQWIVAAPMTTSPAYLVRTLRQHTSQRIFTDFPSLTRENPSGDFWAPGYYITSGSQIIQVHLVMKFIDQIREQQGVHNQGSDSPQ